MRLEFKWGAHRNFCPPDRWFKIALPMFSQFAIAFGFISFHFVPFRLPSSSSVHLFSFFSFLCCNLNTPWKMCRVVGFCHITFAEDDDDDGDGDGFAVIRGVSVSHVQFTALILHFTPLPLYLFFFCFYLGYLQLLSAFVAILHNCNSASKSAQLMRLLYSERNWKRMRVQLFNRLPFLLSSTLSSLCFPFVHRSLGAKFHEISTVYS